MLPLKPCLPTSAPVPPAGPGWLHDIKHDVAKYALAGAFDDKEIPVLVEALDQAWAHLHKSGSPVVENGHAEAARELLALRIIEIAQLVERDPVARTRC
jgi:hypothetical protein